jgi:hypothetical protein
MKTHPIIFSGPMVRALLEGRKQMTRRIINPQPKKGCVYSYNEGCATHVAAYLPNPLVKTEKGNCAIKRPYGKPGDLLWVRETFCDKAIYAEINKLKKDRVHYAADGKKTEWRYFPSIHMPRWASRLTLEITDVRVERLQDISVEDAIAEGLKAITKDGTLVKYGIPDKDGLPGTDDVGWEWFRWREDPCMAFAEIWESINGKGAWAANSWVWVLVFKIHHCNVDDLIKHKAA